VDIPLPPISEVTQSLLYSPENEARGVYGNCLQAAIASALGLDLDAVPHFAAFSAWETAAVMWLRERALAWQVVDGIPPDRSIVIGNTIRGTGRHAVVGDDGQVVWDPHPTHTGLTGVIYSYALEALA
jgi:hypothetical protein